MRDQAIGRSRAGRRRPVRAKSSSSIPGKGAAFLRWILRAVPPALYLSVLILATWLLYYSITSPFFTVKEIAVSGNRLLEARQLVEVAGSLGRNTLLLRADALEQSIRSLVVVRENRAVLVLPGRVEIAVTERTPLVQWLSREGSFLVDKEGVVFSREPPSGRVIVVRALESPMVEIGGHLDPAVLAAVEAIDGALAVLPGMRPPWYDLSGSKGIVVPGVGGPTIVFGDASDLDSKLSALAAIQSHLQATKARAEMVDLRFKDRPTYVLVSTASD